MKHIYDDSFWNQINKSAEELYAVVGKRSEEEILEIIAELNNNYCNNNIYCIKIKRLKNTLMKSIPLTLIIGVIWFFLQSYTINKYDIGFIGIYLSIAIAINLFFYYHSLAQPITEILVSPSELTIITKQLKITDIAWHNLISAKYVEEAEKTPLWKLSFDQDSFEIKKSSFSINDWIRLSLLIVVNMRLRNRQVSRFFSYESAA
jgi:hypothetical protein